MNFSKNIFKFCQQHFDGYENLVWSWGWGWTIFEITICSWVFKYLVLNYTVFRARWCTYLPGSPKLNKQANPKDAVFRITGGKILAGSQACQMENLFWMAKCYEIVKFLDLTQRLTQRYNFQFILNKLNRDQKHRNHNWIANIEGQNILFKAQLFVE